MGLFSFLFKSNNERYEQKEREALQRTIAERLNFWEDEDEDDDDSDDYDIDYEFELSPQA